MPSSPAPKRRPHPRHERPVQRPDILGGDILATYEISHRSGSLGALLSALDWCLRQDIAAPRWVLEASYVAMVSSVADKGPKRRGRSADPITEYRMLLIHFARYEAVKQVREKQAELPQSLAELRKMKNVPRQMLKDSEAMVRWLGRSWIRAYDCARALVEGTEAFGASETMKASYQLVNRMSHDPRTPLLFHLPSTQVLTDLGLLNVFEPNRNRGRKVRPLYLSGY
jgi:hypothetical protein